MRFLLGLTALCVAIGSVRGEGVARRYQDIDDDGQPEIIVENDYVSYSVLTGIEPEKRPDKVFPNGRKMPYKYGARFNWAGWVYGMEFKPTGRSWFVNQDDAGENWHGIPEEFEEAILMSELEPGVYATLLPGIGTAVGRGLCFRGSLRDVKHAPWQIEEERLDNGKWVAVKGQEAATGADGWRIRFTQEISTEYGYGCKYVKEMTLLAGKSALETRRVLENTGKKDFQTTWFTHGFWGQGKDGAFDRDCWSIVPLRPPQIVGSAYPNTLRDVEPGYVREFKPAYYWGPISREEIGGNWHACGNRASGDVFITGLDRDIAFFRVWTDSKTYSIEPFLAIDLKAGAKYEWNDLRGMGNGLKGLKAYGNGGMLDWEVKNTATGKAILFKFVPFTALKGELTLKGAIEKPGLVKQLDLTADAAGASPTKPWSVEYQLPEAMVDCETLNFRLDVMDGDSSLVKVNGTYRLDVTPRAAVNGRAKGEKVVLLADTSKDEEGNWKPNLTTRYWEGALTDAGFGFQLTSSNSGGDEVAWEGVSVAIVASSRISPANLRRLEELAKRGGAVIIQGMIDHRSYEQSDLLPVCADRGVSSVHSTSPRDGTREFEEINEFRYHLKATGEHSITSGLPFYPESYQGLGAIQRVVPKPGTEVVLTAVAGRSLGEGELEHPALIIGKYGRGKVAFFASPIAWGAPQACSIWGRLGEYHQKFLAQFALWGIESK